MKHLSKLLLLVLIALVPVAAQAGQSVVIIADLENGLALIPEGSAIPHGLTIYARVINHEPKTAAGVDGVAPAGESIHQQRLEWAFAPESRFAAARKTIAAAPAFATAADRVFTIAPDDSDVTYYVYFVDGSYHAARRIISGSCYGAQASVYTPAGDYYNGTLEVTLSSTEEPFYDETDNLYINSSGGSVGTYFRYVCPITSSTHIISTGHIGHHYLPICGHYGEPPCNESYNGTLDFYFP